MALPARAEELGDAADGQIGTFRCAGKRFLPIFLASFIVPGWH
jgi:hypothetical protein